MKILFTQDALVNAGAERSHLEILSRFSEEIEVTLVYFYPKHDLKEEYEKAGIRLIFLDIHESYHFPLAISRLVKLIGIEKPDLLISSLYRADQITRITSFITGIPLIGTLVNDSYAPIAWKDKKGLKHKIVYWLDRLTSRIPMHWIANAQALKESHVKTLRLEAERISVVYRGREVPDAVWNGYTVDRLGSKSVDCLDTNLEGEKNLIPPLQRGAGGIDSPEEAEEGFGSFRFISYGRLLERKGFQDAIQAFASVNQKFPNCSLTIYGEGPYRRELERLVHYIGLENSIFLPGKISNPMSLLTSCSQSFSDTIGYLETKPQPTPVRRAGAPRRSGTNNLQPTSFHCFLFPSWYEGFSGALVEAMMSGIPIIASDIAMNLEAVNDENALIFETQNTMQLADQMIFAIENPDHMASLGVKAREEAIARFDIEKIAKEYEEAVFRIVRSKG